MKVDYHTHTNHSDGKLSPTELMKWAKQNEISKIAVTDHDLVSGLMEARIAGEALDIELIPGVELSAEFDGSQVHILGYYIDTENQELLQFCQRALEYRKDRNDRLMAQLVEDGLLAEEDLEEIKGEAKGGYIGKPVLARKMVGKGLFKDVGEVFEKVFESPKYRKIKKDKQPADKAIKAIVAAGGIAVWAHPGKTKLRSRNNRAEFWEEAFAIAREMKKAGLKGIEAIHPAHSDEDRLAAIEIAEKLHLHITEGSDYHGD